MELKNLKKHIRILATLKETRSPVISCYLNHENGLPGYRDALDERIHVLRKSLPAKVRQDFEKALGRIEVFIAGNLFPDTRGAVIFARSGSEPFFLPLQFRVPLPNWIAVGDSPNIYHLVELKDTYHRYVVMLSSEESARILEVNLGAVTKQVWKERPELRKRVGREWTKQHYQNHRRDRTKRFIKEKTEILEKLISKGGYAHLILAGNPQITSRIKKSLPKNLREKLIDLVTAAENDKMEDIVAATLSVFVDQEERESQAKVEKLQQEINTHGLAVAGTRDSFRALMRGAGDVLVMAKDYETGSGWACKACGMMDTEGKPPKACPECGERRVGKIDIKEEMVRQAEQQGCHVEVVEHSDALMQLGGVGCLLRYLVP